MRYQSFWISCRLCRFLQMICVFCSFNVFLKERETRSCWFLHIFATDSYNYNRFINNFKAKWKKLLFYWCCLYAGSSLPLLRLQPRWKPKVQPTRIANSSKMGSIQKAKPSNSQRAMPKSILPTRLPKAASTPSLSATMDCMATRWLICLSMATQPPSTRRRKDQARPLSVPTSWIRATIRSRSHPTGLGSASTTSSSPTARVPYSSTSPRRLLTPMPQTQPRPSIPSYTITSARRPSQALWPATWIRPTATSPSMPMCRLSIRRQANIRHL